MRHFRPLPALALSALISLGAGSPLRSQEHEHAAAATEKLGEVSFPTGCSAEVAPRFERAVAMLHSFWFTEAARAFEEIAAADPRCAMAAWGTAMTLMGNPMTRVLPPAEAMRTGLAAAEKARALAAGDPDALLITACAKQSLALQEKVRAREGEARLRCSPVQSSYSVRKSPREAP